MGLSSPLIWFKTFDITEVFWFQAGAAAGGRHFEPQVAMLCPDKGDLANKLFHNKFLASNGESVINVKI